MIYLITFFRIIFFNLIFFHWLRVLDHFGFTFYAREIISEVFIAWLSLFGAIFNCIKWSEENRGTYNGRIAPVFHFFPSVKKRIKGALFSDMHVSLSKRRYSTEHPDSIFKNESPVCSSVTTRKAIKEKIMREKSSYSDK